DDVDHTLALAMIVFATITIFGTTLEVGRWLRRRKHSNRRKLEWETADALYRRAQESFGFDSVTPLRLIPPPPGPPAETEKLARHLQQILDDLRTRPDSPPSAADELPVESISGSSRYP